MTPERIVIINDQSVANGGAAVLALLSAQLFADMGLPVTYMAGDDPIRTPLDRQKIEVLGLGRRQLLERPTTDGVTSGLFSPGAARWLGAQISERDTPGTIYHLHGWSQVFSPSAFSALSQIEDRLVISAHDFGLACPNLGYADYPREAACPLTPLSLACVLKSCDKRHYGHKLWRVARSAIQRRLFNPQRTSATIAIIHPSMADWLERGGVPRARMRTIRNPVTPYSAQRVTAENNDAVFFIGRVSREKGADLAAAAARQAGWPITIIGDGEQRAALAKAYPEARFEGWLTHDAIAERIGQARAVIMPSRHLQPFGLVALEAMRSGAPLVAFADAFVAEEAAALGAAVVAHERSVDALAQALSTLDDDDTVQRMSAAGFERASELCHTPESWRDALLTLYQEQLRSARTQAA